MPTKHGISSDLCTSCGACVEACPLDAIYEHGDTFVIDPNKCNNCGECVDSCPVEAISTRYGWGI